MTKPARRPRRCLTPEQRERRRATRRAWKRANPEKVAAQKARYAARHATTAALCQTIDMLFLVIERLEADLLAATLA